MIDYKNLSESQLILLANENQVHDEKLNKEWFKRYSMNFPYKLNIQGKIVNSILGVTIEDSNCDKSILMQANQLRERLFNG